MANQTVLTITHSSAVALQTLKNELLKSTSMPKQEGLALVNFFSGAASGSADRFACSVDVQVNGGTGVAASGTITFSSIADGDTVTVGTQTFTAKTSGASGANQFNIGVSDTAAATNFAAKVNAHTSLTSVVTASAASAVTTITAAMVGLIGNQIGIAISAHGSVSAAKLASGANYSANVYHFGV